jgi:hypothetical protein
MVGSTLSVEPALSDLALSDLWLASSMVGQHKKPIFKNLYLKPIFIFPDLAHKPEEISINSIRQISY